MWYTVRQWAITNGYNFANAGREGNDGTDGASYGCKIEPVTYINWRDAIVWCNAYSQMSGFTPCYTYLLVTIKESRNTNSTACDGAVCNWSANGYRLPTEGEWQFAASNKGATPYNYASGATADYNDATECQRVAWYNANSGSATHDVGTKDANALGLYDMSGNVWEWCWDWINNYPTTLQTAYRGDAETASRVVRGGIYNNLAYYLQVGGRGNYAPYSVNFNYGFRVARSNQ